MHIAFNDGMATGRGPIGRGDRRINPGLRIALLRTTKVKYADTIAALAEWVPDPAVRRKIGGETPLRLYFS